MPIKTHDSGDASAWYRRWKDSLFGSPSFIAEWPIVAVDPAAPGADRTAVHTPTQLWRDIQPTTLQAVADDLAWRKLWDELPQGPSHLPVYDEGFYIAFEQAAPGTIVWSQCQDPTVWAMTDGGVQPLPEPPPAPPTIPTEPSHEHIWNMLVLAAESSRYGDK